MIEVDIATGALRNLSNDPAHDETQLFTDERFGLEESNRASDPDGALRGISSLPAEGIAAALAAVGRESAATLGELPEYSPHGGLRGVNRPFDLFVISMDGSARVRQLTKVSPLGGNAHQSVPSRDGRHIAFALLAPPSGPFAGKGGL